MRYSAYKLNKQGDNIQPWHTPFPIWNQSLVPLLQVDTDPLFEFPEPYSKFLLAIYFTYGNVSFHVTLSIHLTLSSPLPMSTFPIHLIRLFRTRVSNFWRNQTEKKEKYCILTHIYIEFRKMVLKSLFTGQQWRSSHIENRLMNMGVHLSDLCLCILCILYCVFVFFSDLCLCILWINSKEWDNWILW